MTCRPTGYRSLRLSICSRPPDDGEPDEPVRVDGYLKPEWLEADFAWTTNRLSPLGAAGSRGRRIARCPAGRPRRSTEGAGDGTIGVRRRVALRRAVVRWVADGSFDCRGDRCFVHRSSAAERCRGCRAAAGARRRGVASFDQPGVRSAQPGAGEVAAARHRRRVARHPGLAPRGDPRHTPVDRRVAGMAQGRTDGDHVRVRLARRAPRCRRAGCVANGRDATARRVG